MNINLYHLHLRRQIQRPLWELKRWREENAKPVYGHMKQWWLQIKWTAFWLLIVFVLCLMAGCSYAEDIDSPVSGKITPKNAIVAQINGYPVGAWANAIKQAEGTWTYGIKTIKCNEESVCRHICITTIRNNWRRYQDYGYKLYPRYIQFLASRYCPTSGRNLTASERKLNRYWIKNVEYYLRRG